MVLATTSTGWADDRSFDGSANNPEHSTWGTAGSTYYRAAGFHYDDGISAPAGADWPEPRVISNVVGDQQLLVPSTKRHSGFVYAFGQFLNHDVERTRSSTAEALPIVTPPDDPHFRGRMLTFNRSAFDPSTGTSGTNPREQVNGNTSYIDASTVYGSSEERANQLRVTTPEGLGAKLRTSQGDLLPLNSVVAVEMDNGGFQRSDALFSAGDFRANENIALTSLHTLFMREHNRLVDELSVAQPGWSAEQLYQRARKIVGAEMQAITFQEFLPALLGPHAPTLQGYYNPNVDPATSNEFATVFLRVGHSMLPPNFRRIEDDGQAARLDPVSVGTSPFVPRNFLQGNATDLDVHLKGLALEQQEEVDTFFVDEMRNIVNPGIDLFAIDIQRARDHGLADYNTMRAAYGLTPVSSFSEITSEATLQASLADVYGDVNSIDAIVGALAEDHLDGAAVGPLTAAGLVEQFVRLRDGDRFWFTNDPDFTPLEIEELKTTHLADVIRRNTNVTSLQDNVFFLPALGDFDADQQFTFQDADLLCSQLARGARDVVRFDITGDGRLNHDDLNRLLEIGQSLPGDADFNGIVDFADFTRLADGFDGRGSWSSGNFNCDRPVDFDDFVILAEHFGESRAAQNVPEPVAGWALGWAGVGWLLLSRLPAIRRLSRP